MLEADFGEKCIIMHFLGMEKDGKASEKCLNAETRRAQRRDKCESRSLAARDDTVRGWEGGVEKLVDWDVDEVVECLWRRSVYPREVGAGFLFLGMFAGRLIWSGCFVFSCWMILF